MAKGVGLENVRKFAWVEQPNGRFSIFSVPIFKAFQDEKRGEASLQDLQDVVRNFEADKEKNLRYPRVHVGHHETLENRPGAGYLDNFVLTDDIIFADLVEIPRDVFEEIRNNLKYPYVSAEYNPDRRKINSVALLESQTPYFQEFPLLALADAPEEIHKYQNYLTYWDERQDKILKFQEKCQEGGCPCMADQEEKKDEESESSEKDKMVEQPEEKYKCQLEDAGLGAKIDRLLAMVEEIHSWEKEEHEGMGMEEEGMEGMDESSEPMPQEESDMKNPESVAYQDNSFKKYMIGLNKTLKEMSKRIFALEAEKVAIGTENQLKKFCQESGLNYQEYLPLMRKFSSVTDRETFIETLKMTAKAQQSPTKHPAAKMAQKFAAGSVSKKMTGEDAVVSKFAENQQPVARKAYQVFQEIVAQPTVNARRFQQAWQSVDIFVKSAIEDPTILQGLERNN